MPLARLPALKGLTVAYTIQQTGSSVKLMRKGHQLKPMPFSTLTGTIDFRTLTGTIGFILLHECLFVKEEADLGFYPTVQ